MIDVAKGDEVVVDEPGEIFRFGREADAVPWFWMVLGWEGDENMRRRLLGDVGHWLVNLDLGLDWDRVGGVVLGVVGNGDGA